MSGGLMRGQANATKNDNGTIRTGARRTGPTPPLGPIIGDIWYDSAAQTLKVFNGSAWIPVPSSSPTFSGTVSANQFKVSPDDIDDAKIDLWGGTYLIGIRSNTMYFKSGGTRFDFETPSGTWAFRFGPYVNGAETGLKVEGNTQSQETYTNGWFRNLTAGNGYYFQGAGTNGGWHMNNGDGWIRSYGDKNVYTAGEFRANVAGITNWRRDGNYAVFGHVNMNVGTDVSSGKGYSFGYGQASDGHLLMSTNFAWRVRRDIGTGDFTLFYAELADAGANKVYCYVGGAVVDFRAALVGLTGTAVVLAGSNQLGWNASTKEVKRAIKDLPERGDANPLWKLKPRRFLWDETKIENAKEYNKRCPDGFAGMIAEEVAASMPDAVHFAEDGSVRSWDERAVISYLVAGMLDMKEEIDKLKKLKGKDNGSGTNSGTSTS